MEFNFNSTIDANVMISNTNSTSISKFTTSSATSNISSRIDNIIFSNESKLNISKHLFSLTAKDSLYVYSWDPKRNIWIIGNTNEESEWGNAVIRGTQHCPVEIIIPGRFKSTDQDSEYPVEIVGVNAFNWCGRSSSTKSIFVPKEVKEIRKYGFSSMHYIKNFTIEVGSQLEIIGLHALNYIGYEISDRNSTMSPEKTLILPSSLKQVEKDGISQNNRFTRIIYCGFNDLNQNTSKLEDSEQLTKLYVKKGYKRRNGNEIFGREVSSDLSDEQIDKLCEGYTYESGDEERPVSFKPDLRLSLLAGFVLDLFSVHDEWHPNPISSLT